MSFGKPRYNKNYDWELLRYCTIKNVIGGASRLFKGFERNFSGSIISYEDMRWSCGTVYQKLGFNKIRESSPNYWYFKGNLSIENRIKYQKHKLKNILENMMIT